MEERTIDFKNCIRPMLHQLDTTGVVYIGADRVYRRISPDARDITLELLNSGLFKELVERRLLPETWIEEKTENSLVLGHKKADFILYASEWTFSMLKKAVLTLIEVHKVCEKHGWFLQDGHLWNVVFFGDDPMLVDFGSLKKGKAEPDWPFFKELVANAFFPLLLWSGGDFYMANLILSDTYPNRLQPFPTFSNAPVYFEKLKVFRKKRDLQYWFGFFCNLFLIPFPPLRKYQFKIWRYRTLRNPAVCEVQREAEKLQPPKVWTEWDAYHEPNYSDGEVSSRFLRIIELLKSIDWTTAVDLAGNGGYFTMQVLKNFPEAKMLCLDYDSRAIERAYTRNVTAEEPYKNLTCGMVNFCYPSDGHIPLSGRISSDLVIALAVTHHLFLRQSISSEVFFDFLHDTSKKYLAIEFMPLGLWREGVAPPVPAWYTEEWFRKELDRRFAVIVREQLEENRVFFLCHRR
jgi:hypothetical protein